MQLDHSIYYTHRQRQLHHLFENDAIDVGDDAITEALRSIPLRSISLCFVAEYCHKRSRPDGLQKKRPRDL